MKMSFFHSLWFSGLPLVFVSPWYFPLPAMLSFALGFWTLMNDSSLFVFSPAACVLTRCGSWRLKCEKQPSGEIQVSRSYEIPNCYEITLFSPSRSSSRSHFKPTLLATAKKKGVTIISLNIFGISRLLAPVIYITQNAIGSAYSEIQVCYASCS